MAATLLRRVLAACALLATAAALAVAAPAAPASADPEGGTKTLRDALESAARGHVEAKAKLAASQKRQTQLQITLVQANTSAQKLAGQVAVIAARSYRLGRFNTVSLLLNSSSPDTFLERAYRLDQMALLDARTLARYRADIDLAQRAKAGDRPRGEGAAEAGRRAGQEEGGGRGRARQRRRRRGVRRLPQRELAAGQGRAAQLRRVVAQESCTVDDPTTVGLHHAAAAQRVSAGPGGRLHALHVLLQRSGRPASTRKGRACDFSANASTFKNSARDRQRQGVRRTASPRTSSRTPTGSA